MQSIDQKIYNMLSDQGQFVIIQKKSRRKAKIKVKPKNMDRHFLYIWFPKLYQ